MSSSDNAEKSQKLIQALDKQDDKITNKLSELKEEFSDVMTIDKYNLEGEIIRTIGNKQRFISMLMEEKNQMNKLSRKLKQRYVNLYNKHKHNGQMRFDNRHDIEQYIYKDSQHQVLETVINNQKTLIDYLDYIVKALNSKEFSLKNIIEIKRLERS